MESNEGYVERRKVDRSGCVQCGGEIVDKVGLLGEVNPGCINATDIEHSWNNRRKSVKCGCGKWQCPAPGDQSSGGIWSCYQHPDYGFDTSTDTGNMSIPKHHTDGTQACETNHRSPEEQTEWDADHANWKTAQKMLPDMGEVMAYLEDIHYPLSFDGHDNFEAVKKNPWAAAICIQQMYDTLRGIQIGQEALAKLPLLKDR